MQVGRGIRQWSRWGLLAALAATVVWLAFPPGTGLPAQPSDTEFTERLPRGPSDPQLPAIHHPTPTGIEHEQETPHLSEVHIVCSWSDTGERVAAATIFSAHGQDAPRVVGLTDEDGLLIWHVGTLEGLFRVSGRAEGGLARDETVMLPTHEAREVQVTLLFERATAAEGRVEWESGHAVTEPVLVYAWPVGERPSAEQLLFRQELVPPGTRARTDSQGRFRLEGLPVDTDIEVVVAADGCFFVGHRSARHPSGDLLEPLVIERLFGAVVSIHDISGGPLQAPYGSYGPRGASYHALDERAADRKASMGGLSWALAGIDRTGMGLDGWRRRLVLVAGPEDALELGPYEVTIDIPGYEWSVTSFVLDRLDRSISEVPIPLTSNHNGVGSVQLVLRGRHAAVPGPTGLSYPEAVLRLADGTGATFEIPVRAIHLDEPHLIEQVPQGQYLAWLEFTSGFSPTIDAQDVVVDGSLARLEFDVGDVGTCELVIRTPGNGEWTGPLAVQVTHEGGGRSRYLHFDEGPYTLNWLAARAYRLVLERPAPGEHGSYETSVRVRAGESIRATLRP